MGTSQWNRCFRTQTSFVFRHQEIIKKPLEKFSLIENGKNRFRIEYNINRKGWSYRASEEDPSGWAELGGGIRISNL
jgi:hypothetical protein